VYERPNPTDDAMATSLIVDLSATTSKCNMIANREIGTQASLKSLQLISSIIS
jgi:hypothetical protein